MVRVTDFTGVIPAITGKVELVYEGEQEGAYIVAQHLIGKAIRTLFSKLFPSPEKLKKGSEVNPYQLIIDWFSIGNELDLLCDITNTAYKEALMNVDGLKKLVEKYHPNLKGADQLFMMEFVLHGLSEFSKLSKKSLVNGLKFKDIFSSVFNIDDMEEDEK